MDTVSEFMAANHRECDALFSRAEALIARDDWEKGRTAFDRFAHSMKLHFSAAEGVLFPVIESRTGGTLDPIERMRVEHEHMRTLLSDMESAVAEEARDLYLGIAEHFLASLRQHAQQAQEVLYPVSEQVLGSEGARIVNEMKAV